MRSYAVLLILGCAGKEAADMKSLFEATTSTEIKTRIARLEPGSQRQWGKMNAARQPWSGPWVTALHRECL